VDFGASPGKTAVVTFEATDHGWSVVAVLNLTDAPTCDWPECAGRAVGTAPDNGYSYCAAHLWHRAPGP